MGNTEERKFSFCPSIADFPLSNLIVECSDCTRFFAACCADKSFGGDLYDEDKKPCHHNQLVFTDGACVNNGLVNAKAGLGFTIGTDDEYCWSISVDDTIDGGAPRTNQRAELLAAIKGLKQLHEVNVENGSHKRKRHKQDSPRYIVVTDSEYVTKGITEWFPSWERRGWRTSTGNRPANLDLFMTLNEYVTSLEQEHIEVAFLHVPRAYNHNADVLAKRAANI